MNNAEQLSSQENGTETSTAWDNMENTDNAAEIESESAGGGVEFWKGVLEKVQQQKAQQSAEN